MGKPLKAQTVRLNEDLGNKVNKYLERNTVFGSFNDLAKIAIEQFISKEQTIELKAVNSDDWDKSMSKAYKKHKKTMDELG